MGWLWNLGGEMAEFLDPTQGMQMLVEGYKQKAIRMAVLQQQAELMELDEQLFGDGEDDEEEEQQQQQDPRLGQQQRPALNNNQQPGGNGGRLVIPRRKGRPPGSKNKSKPQPQNLTGPQPSQNGNGEAHQ